jgi:hypothetical protein
MRAAVSVLALTAVLALAPPATAGDPDVPTRTTPSTQLERGTMKRPPARPAYWCGMAARFGACDVCRAFCIMEWILDMTDP